MRLGIAPHSLRAVPGPALLRGGRRARPDRPGRADPHPRRRAGQRGARTAWPGRGRRPVEWLLEQAPGRCALVPGACDPYDRRRDRGGWPRAARSPACARPPRPISATACSRASYLAAGGRFGIGSDSHISVSPIEELRWLEYGQRLRQLAAGRGRAPARAALRRPALARGARRRRPGARPPIGRLAPGCRADLSCSTPIIRRWSAGPATALLDAWCSPATPTRSATSWSAAAGWSGTAGTSGATTSSGAIAPRSGASRRDARPVRRRRDRLPDLLDVEVQQRDARRSTRNSRSCR